MPWSNIGRESVEMFRKVCLTGLISVFRRGSLFQLVIGAFLSMLSLAASAFFQPYEDHIANVSRKLWDTQHVM
jgi:hypothetical protein